MRKTQQMADGQNVAEVLVASDHQSIPNIPANEIYPFRAAPSAAEVAQWIIIGKATASGAPVGLAAVRVAHDFSAGVLQWCLAEATGVLPYGCRVVCNVPKVKGQKVVSTLPSQLDVCLIC